MGAPATEIFSHPTMENLLSSFRSGRLDPVTAIDTALIRLELEGRRLNCVAALRQGAARNEAAAATDRWRTPSARPLEGVPIGIKDVIDVAGCSTGGGTPALSTSPATSSATAVQRLTDAGAIVVAKLATTPLAFADPFGPGVEPSVHPLDSRRFPGSTSSGSAAALAAGLVPLSLGTDSAGSSRIPAAHCGVVGFKPTFGAIPHAGVLPGAGSLDHIGIMAHTVDDVRAAFAVIADLRSEHSLRAGLIRAGNPFQTRPRIGVLSGSFTEHCTSAGLDCYFRATSLVERLGADVVALELPMMDQTADIAWTIASAEFARACDSLALDRARCGGPLNLFVDQGRALDRITYQRYVDARAAYTRTIADAMCAVDFVICPTVQTVAPLLDGLISPTADGDRPWVEIAARNTLPFNLTGMPAVTIPAGAADFGLPFGVQLAAQKGQDDMLLAFAARFEAEIALARNPAAGASMEGEHRASGS